MYASDLWNARLDKSQVGIKIAWRNTNNLRYADDTTLMAESEEELKSLDESERGEWKSWLKSQHSENEDHGIRSHHFMANRWGNNGSSDRLYFGGLQKSLQMVTAAMKLKMLAPWKKSYDQPRQHIKKQTLLTKIHLVKVMVFPVVIDGFESWTIK